MKVAFVHNLPTGGARRFSFYQLKFLRELGYQVVEFAPSTANVEHLNFKPVVEKQFFYPASECEMYSKRIPLLTPYIHSFQGIRALKDQQKLMRKMAADIDAAGFDLVFVADGMVMACPYVLRYLQTPSVFYCHGLDRPYHREKKKGLKEFYYWPAYWLFRSLYIADEQENAKFPRVVITNSNYSAKKLSEMYGRSIQVIYPGIDVDLFRPLNLEREPYLLCVGAMIRQKGYRFLVSALSLIEEKWRLPLRILANSIDTEEWRIVQKMAVERGVKLEMQKVEDDEQLVQIYNRAKVFVYAPYNEALGLAPLEAMACGTPVVAVGEAGVVEVMADNMEYVTKRDEVAFSQKIQEVLREPGGQNLNLRDMVCQKWNWQFSIERLIKYFRDTTNSQGGIK